MAFIECSDGAFVNLDMVNKLGTFEDSEFGTIGVYAELDSTKTVICLCETIESANIELSAIVSSANGV